MKKALALLLALVMVLSLAACSAKEATKEATKQTEQAEQTPTERTPSEIELCAEYAIEKLKSALKSPDSLVIHSLYAVGTDEGYMFSVDYTADNSFGGPVRDSFFLDVSKIDNGFAVKTYGSGSFIDDDNQKYTAQFMAKQQKHNGYYLFDTQTLQVAGFVEGTPVSVERIEEKVKLKGKNNSYEGAWNAEVGESNFLKLVYFVDGVDLSWYEKFTGHPYEITISAVLNDGVYTDAEIVYDPVLDATKEERAQRFDYYDREFVKENAQNYTRIPVEELNDLLSDKSFSMRNNYGGDDGGNHTIHFYGDGTLDAKYTSDGTEYTMYESWKIENDAVVLQRTSTNVSGKTTVSEYRFEAYRFDEMRILLLCYESDCSMVLTMN